MPASPGFKELFMEELVRLGAEARREIVFCDRIDSTSTDLRRRLASGLRAGSVVAAARQDDGKGRRGNRWYSPAGGNLYVSLAVAIDAEHGHLSFLPLAAGVAAWDAVERTAPVGARLKWPNDLLAAGRKLAGVLCELPGAPDRSPIAIAGLGMNVNTTGFPGELAGIAVSLAELTRDPPEPAVLAAHWVAGLEQWVARLADGKSDALAEAWRERAEPFGRRVRIGGMEGRTVDLLPDGRLVLRKDNGDTQIVSGGVVEYL